MAGRDLTITTLPTAVQRHLQLLLHRDRPVRSRSHPDDLRRHHHLDPETPSPVARSLGLAANVGVPITSRVPVFDPNGDRFTALRRQVTTGFDRARVDVHGGWSRRHDHHDRSQRHLHDSVHRDGTRGSDGEQHDHRDGRPRRRERRLVRGAATSARTPLANACEISLPDLVPGDCHERQRRLPVRCDRRQRGRLVAASVRTCRTASARPSTALACALTPRRRGSSNRGSRRRSSRSSPTTPRSTSSVAIAGYVAVPMGRVAVITTPTATTSRSTAASWPARSTSPIAVPWWE